MLDAYAGVCTLIGHRAAGAFETVRRAAADAPEVAELWETLLRSRRAGAAMVVDRLLTLDGPLRPARAPDARSTRCGSTTTRRTTRHWCSGAGGRRRVSGSGSPPGCATRCWGRERRTASGTGQV
ncbi:hypothetical protein V2I01_02895 [Micromonospora sp. BRA006-A]|nr:hypothetical protein [Micromonospora sp. BRA006-A]